MKTIKILGYTYEVQLIDKSFEMRASGHTHSGKQLVRVALDQCDEGKLTTLLHEVIEAIIYHQQIDLPNGEADVMRLEVGLFSFLTDNGIDLSPLEELLCKE